MLNWFINKIKARIADNLHTLKDIDKVKPFCVNGSQRLAQEFKMLPNNFCAKGTVGALKGSFDACFFGDV